MSRIGKLPITVPSGVKVEYDGKVVTVTGPKGSLKQDINSKYIGLDIKPDVVEVKRTSDIKDAKAAHGLYRMLVANMVAGVNTPFTKTILIKGVGYKAAVNGDKLTMNIGLSHAVEVIAPKGITLECPDPLSVRVTGISKELVGQTAATIRSKKPVEPYHNYGLRYSDEVVVKKEGKTSGKK